MLYSLVFLAIGALLLLIIVYNMIQQYKEKIDAERRALIFKHKAVIDETDDVMRYASRLPFSKQLVLLLYRRILASLDAILASDPSQTSVAQRKRDIQLQLKNIEADYSAPDESMFRAPESDKQALELLQTVKKIRTIVRTEHGKGRLAPDVYQHEDRVLELLQLKINVNNAIKRALDARINNQAGTAKQLLTKAKTILDQVEDKDEYIENKIAEVIRALADIEETQRKSGERERQALEEKEREKDELDILFQPKRKW